MGVADVSEAVQSDVSEAVQTNVSEAVQSNVSEAVQSNVSEAVQSNVTEAVQLDVPATVQSNVPPEATDVNKVLNLSSKFFNLICENVNILQASKRSSRHNNITLFNCLSYFSQPTIPRTDHRSNLSSQIQNHSNR